MNYTIQSKILGKLPFKKYRITGQFRMFIVSRSIGHLRYCSGEVLNSSLAAQEKYFPTATIFLKFLKNLK